ncbi:Dynein light chain [Sparganum proliferum]
MVRSPAVRYPVEQDAAAYIKRDFEREHSKYWHCIVGKHFGSFVSHERNTFFHAFCGQFAVLIWKAGRDSKY